MKILGMLFIICLFAACIGAVLLYIDYQTELCRIEAQKLGFQYDFIQGVCYVKTDSMDSWISLTTYRRLLAEKEIMDEADK